MTYASETCVLQESVKGKLFVTGRKIFRIFGPTGDGDGTWRIKTNDVLNNLVRNKNIISYTMAQKLSWFGHVHLKTNDRMVKKVYKWKLKSTVLGGRPKTGWENDIKEDLRIMKFNNWTKCIQVRVK